MPTYDNYFHLRWNSPLSEAPRSTAGSVLVSWFQGEIVSIYREAVKTALWGYAFFWKKRQPYQQEGLALCLGGTASSQARIAIENAVAIEVPGNDKEDEHNARSPAEQLNRKRAGES